MITRQDLQAAIAECQGQKNPTSSTCIKLAAFQIILDHMDQDQLSTIGYSTGDAGYSFSPGGDSEFLQKVAEVDPVRVWNVIDELVTAVKILNPRLYDGMMRKLDDL